MSENNREGPLTRMGAVLSIGILNAGGRNTTISMETRDGHLKQNAICGLVLFMQHWYWYPMLNFISLALSPTVLIAVDKNLKVPKSFTFTSKAKPKTFQYPELLKKTEVVAKEKLETFTLSTTAKVKARVDRKKGVTGDVEMAEDKPKEEEKKEEVKVEKKEEPEPEFLLLHNPTRILNPQEQKIIYDQFDGRYMPVLETRYAGFIVVKELRPANEGEVELFYDDEERNMDAPNPDLDPDLPEAFEFDPIV